MIHSLLKGGVIMSNSFGKELKLLRSRQGYSLRQLENQSGISYSYISQIERGERKTPKISTLKALAHGLRVPAEKLLNMAHINTSHDIYEDIKNGDVMTWQGHPINKTKLEKWFKEGHWL